MDDFEVITWFSKGIGGGYSERLLRESLEYYRGGKSGKFCCDTIKIL